MDHMIGDRGIFLGGRTLITDLEVTPVICNVIGIDSVSFHCHLK